MPSAECDLRLTTFDKGLLSAMVFFGNSPLITLCNILRWHLTLAYFRHDAGWMVVGWVGRLVGQERCFDILNDIQRYLRYALLSTHE